MNSDYEYAEMLQLMRSQGSKDNPETIKIGVMLSPNSVKLDDLTLLPEDLYIADYLMAGYVYPLVTPYVTDSSFGEWREATNRTSQAVRSEGLKAGDKVAIQKLDNNMYLIFARVVRAG